MLSVLVAVLSVSGKARRQTDRQAGMQPTNQHRQQSQTTLFTESESSNSFSESDYEKAL